ncbi:C40 family peptidase [Mycobacterium intracellulare]|uniref:C40 family peptidase n=1 Tax=Mycobacterium intracellulare TaxID=1767 RepID=UPI000C79EC85|nr:C40 family peptidase [Mycobacterium intracellulare]
MSVAAFVAGVDRLLSRGHELFPAGSPGGGQVFAAGGRAPVPEAPDGHSGLTGGARAAGGAYQQAQAGADGLDGDSDQAVAQGGQVGAQGRAGSGLIRDQARAVGAATAGMGRSPAGAKLIMAAMDDHLAAMQRQLDQTTAENRLLAMRMRQLAAGYRGLGSGQMGGGMPLSGLGGLMSGSGGGGGLSGLSSLASGIPASLMGSVSRGGGGNGGSGEESGTSVLSGGSGTALRAVQQAETKLGCPYIWGATGPRAFDCSGLVQDAYRHVGVQLPRMTYDMIHRGTTVDRADVRAGDLVFSNFSSRGPEHVQLAVSSTKVIEAPTPGGHVQYSGFPRGHVVVKRIVG